jgi:hypothetical protein
MVGAAAKNAAVLADNFLKAGQDFQGLSAGDATGHRINESIRTRHLTD